MRNTFNNNFFTTNSAESFYWAGFIAADGCVTIKKDKYKDREYRQKVLRINLANKDYKHLEKFSDAIDYSGRILSTHNGMASLVVLRSDKIFDDLEKFNIVPCKSLIYTFPQWVIKDKNINHFMRGYFDGDGCFGKRMLKKEKYPQIIFSLCGTYVFLYDYMRVLENKCNITFKEPRKNKNIFEARYTGNSVVKNIRNFLYEGSTEQTRLDRKYNIVYDGILDNTERHKSRYVPIVGTNIYDGSEIHFDSFKSAEIANFIRQAICSCIGGRAKTHKNYIWKYAEQING